MIVFTIPEWTTFNQRSTNSSEKRIKTKKMVIAFAIITSTTTIVHWCYNWHSSTCLEKIWLVIIFNSKRTMLKFILWSIVTYIVTCLFHEKLHFILVFIHVRHLQFKLKKKFDFQNRMDEWEHRLKIWIINFSS